MVTKSHWWVSKMCIWCKQITLTLQTIKLSIAYWKTRHKSWPFIGIHEFPTSLVWVPWCSHGLHEFPMGGISIREDPWSHDYTYKIRPRQTADCSVSNVEWSNLTHAKLARDNSVRKTHKRVEVEYFDDNFGRIVGDSLRISVDLDRVKDERLIPCRTDGFPETLGRLTVVEKHDASERVCTRIHSRCIYSSSTTNDALINIWFFCTRMTTLLLISPTDHVML